MSEQQFGRLADRIAVQEGVNPRLFRLLVRAESGWNPRAGSPAGAQGLTQLMPGTARGLGVRNVFNPEQNLRGGARYLAQQLKAFKGDPRLALAAYNAGPGAVSKYGGVPPYAETQAYVQKILSQFGGGQGTAPQSGGRAPADAGGAPPTLPASPLGGIDTKRLMMLLRNQRNRSLRGIMPAPGFRGELAKIAQQAVPRAQTTATAQNVGEQAAQTGQQVATGSLTAPGGGWGGAEAPALRIAQISGLPITSRKRDRQMTASGNVSDHWTGSTNSYAVDLGTSGSQGDAAFRKIVTALGYPNLQPGRWHNLNIGGYRYQIGWRTPGHYDHIHVGVKKL